MLRQLETVMVGRDLWLNICKCALIISTLWYYGLIAIKKVKIFASRYLTFAKKISQNLLEDILIIIIDNLKKNNKIKISKFGTFTVRNKKSRMGRNPITKKNTTISDRSVVLFKPSNEFKFLVNSLNYEKN